jgi:hypothetical protein
VASCVTLCEVKAANRVVTAHRTHVSTRDWSGRFAWPCSAVDGDAKLGRGTYQRSMFFCDALNLTGQASDESLSGCSGTPPHRPCTTQHLQLNVAIGKPIVSPTPWIS